MNTMLAICKQVNVIPVLVVDQRDFAKPLGESLVQGGLHVLEVTLRTPVALDVIRAMSEVEGAVVGAGTVVNANDVKAAKAAGAHFAVSPGSSPAVLQAALEHDLPLLPGAVTASEVMNLLAQDFKILKFFPAETVGGIALLKALNGPFPQVQFCPTGGVNTDNVADYLSLPNVVCVGGSWLAPSAVMQAGQWDVICQMATAACQLSRVPSNGAEHGVA